MTIYVPFLVPPTILIKVTSYLLLNQALPLPLLLMSFSLMFGPHPFNLLMVFTSVLFLLIITQSTYGLTCYIENRMFIQPLSKQLVENYFSTTIETLYTDNGSGFLALRSFLTTHGIAHLTTPPHTPEHNGYSEHRHRHIVETGLTLLHQASFPLTLWSYAFAMVVYLINRMPKVGLSLGSSFEKLFYKAPDPSKLRVFNCLCFPWLRPCSSHKLDPKSSPCVFLGYSLTQSVFLCFDTTLKKIFVSRHVKFMENVFPFASPLTSTTSVIDTNYALPTSSFTLSDRLCPPHFFIHLERQTMPSPLLRSPRATIQHRRPHLQHTPPPPPPPPPPLSSRRTTSHLPIPPPSPELLRSSLSPHQSPHRAASHPPI